MPSPFPGMDPYIEGEAWQDFHFLFVGRIRTTLGTLLPDRYYVRAEKYVYLIREDQERGLIRPDTFVIETRTPQTATRGAGSAGVTLLGAPVIVPLPWIDYVRQRSLAVRVRGTGRVVCVIEVLSPINKARGTGQGEYLQKRTSVIESTAHLVEIDLLRGGERVPMGRELPAADYYVVVSRSELRPDCGVWPVSLRKPLPVVPVPLLEGDPEVRLDLQTAFDETYDTAGDAGTLDYRTGTEPPLSPEDAVWALERIVGDGGIPVRGAQD